MFDGSRVYFRKKQHRRIFYVILVVVFITSFTISGFAFQNLFLDSLLPESEAPEKSTSSSDTQAAASRLSAMNAEVVWKGTLLNKIKTKFKEKVNIYYWRIAAASLAAITVLCLLGLVAFLLYRSFFESEALMPAEKEDYERYFFSQQKSKLTLQEAHDFYDSYFSKYPIPLPALDTPNAKLLTYIKVDDANHLAELKSLAYDPQDCYVQLIKRLSLAEGQPMVLVPTRLAQGQVYYLSKAEENVTFLVMSVDTAANLHSDVVEERFRATI